MLANALEQIRYHHALTDDPASSRRAVDEVAAGIERWAERVLDGPGEGFGASRAAQNGLNLPASLLPEPPGASFEEAGLGL